MTGMLRRMARSVLAPVSFAQYVAVGVRDPQDLVSVTLVDASGTVRDVTRNHVVAALRPLTLGVMQSADEVWAAGACRLEVRERSHGLLLGTVRLREFRTIDAGAHRFVLFAVVGSRNQCLSAATMHAYHQLEAVRVARYQRRQPHNFQLTTKDLRALFVYYACPRPVVLVSVAHGNASNVLPMDLIGATASPYFSMALRLTSGAIPLIVASKRLALASIPLAYRPIAYQLGAHHKQPRIDVSALPFATRPSLTYGLPVTQDALRVREVEVVAHHEVGSHMLFLTRVVHEERRRANESAHDDALPLHHIHGAFRQFLRRQRVVIPELV